MGKYMKKAKTAGDVAVMDLSLGVRTRAKTLALQRQAHLNTSPVSAGYLQLRSRRLEKLPILLHDSKRQGYALDNNNQQSTPDPIRKPFADSEQKDEEDGRTNKGELIPEYASQKAESNDLGVEASFGENFLEIEGRDRSTRESTPCSLIRDPETIRTPGSTTRPCSSTEARRIILNSTHGHAPTAREMNEFFAEAEEGLRKQFIEKNFLHLITGTTLTPLKTSQCPVATNGRNWTRRRQKSLFSQNPFPASSTDLELRSFEMAGNICLLVMVMVLFPFSIALYDNCKEVGLWKMCRLMVCNIPGVSYTTKYKSKVLCLTDHQKGGKRSRNRV
ncbi:hypothetical protein K2173_018995 [Erythroxylum novogranatense]|uniref:Uncharacterized protein n=1 Tax=Erythroxylum novogranatense TaxID=1862640 RepID=A0AAV8SSB7_9ROSI|nr:hypothetical protein K2173_018995 [Erythroxylum novogranatense]